VQVAAIICTIVCLSTPLASTGFRISVLLTLTSLLAVTLCQFGACCSDRGSDAYFEERLVSE
jgi:hypothetical protein